MNIDFKLPELGENVHSGDVVNMLVKEGDQISANSGLFELETDKAVVEIPCPHAGRIVKLQAKKGDTLKVGQVVATIASGDEAKSSATAAPAAPPHPHRLLQQKRHRLPLHPRHRSHHHHRHLPQQFQSHKRPRLHQPHPPRLTAAVQFLPGQPCGGWPAKKASISVPS